MQGYLTTSYRIAEQFPLDIMPIAKANSSYFPHRITTKPVPTTTPSDLYSNPIARLTTNAVEELSWSTPRDRLKNKVLKKHTLDEYAEVLLLDEVIGFCFKFVELRARQALGKYSHPDDKITEYIQCVFNDMKGSVEEMVGRFVATTSFFGFLTAEIGWKYNTPGYYGHQRLDCLIPHSPLTTRVKGDKDGLMFVVDKSGQTNKEIPYEKCLHICNNLYENDPYGYGTGARTIGLFKVKRTALANAAVNTTNQAQGIWIVRADTSDTVVITDKFGKPLKGADGREMTASAVENAYQQLQSFDKNHYVVLDKKYEINWQPMPVDSAYSLGILDNIDRRLFMTQSVPYLAANEGVGGFGHSGVASFQATNLDSHISALIASIRDQIIEKVVKPMLVNNFGITAKDGWGKFDIDRSSDDTSAFAKAGLLLQGTGAGILSTTDISVINAFRSVLDLPSQTEEGQVAAIQKSVEMQKQQQDITNAIMPPEAQANPEQQTQYP